MATLRNPEVTGRREFFMGSAAAWASAGARAGAKQTRLNRIALMSLCFDPIMKGPTHPPDPKRTLDLMDFPRMAADRYGIHRVELQQTDFSSTEPAYFQEFHRRLKKARSQVNQINLEFANLNISAKDPVIRIEALDLTKAWIDHAVELECPRVMVSQAALTPDLRSSAINTLAAMCAYGRTKGVFITMEPRWRPDAAVNVPWELLVEVAKAAGARINPDCGNFPDNESRAAALPMMYRMTAGSSHIKHFPARFSTEAAIRISKEAGYQGIYTIEERGYNGSEPYAAVQLVLNVLLANI